MELRDVLERDRERLMGAIASCETLEEGVKVSQEELGRILVACSGEEEYEGRGELLTLAVETAKAGVSLLAGVGDPKIYEVAVPPAPVEKKAFPREKQFLALAVLLALAGAFLSLGGVLGILLRLVLSGAALFCMGRTQAPAPVKEEPERFARVRPDGERLFHELSLLLEVMGEQVKRIPLEKGYSPEKTLGEIPLLKGSENAPLSQEECKLLVALLEAAYACEDGEVSREMISLIKYFLHSQGMEAVTDYASRRELFDCMPGTGAALIRPALVMGETLLVRGLAVLREGE